MCGRLSPSADRARPPPDRGRDVRGLRLRGRLVPIRRPRHLGGQGHAIDQVRRRQRRERVEPPDLQRPQLDRPPRFRRRAVQSDRSAAAADVQGIRLHLAPIEAVAAGITAGQSGPVDHAQPLAAAGQRGYRIDRVVRLHGVRRVGQTRIEDRLTGRPFELREGDAEQMLALYRAEEDAASRLGVLHFNDVLVQAGIADVEPRLRGLHVGGDRQFHAAVGKPRERDALGRLGRREFPCGCGRLVHAQHDGPFHGRRQRRRTGLEHASCRGDSTSPACTPPAAAPENGTLNSTRSPRVSTSRPPWQRTSTVPARVRPYLPLSSAQRTIDCGFGCASLRVVLYAAHVPMAGNSRKVIPSRPSRNAGRDPWLRSGRSATPNLPATRVSAGANPTRGRSPSSRACRRRSCPVVPARGPAAPATVRPPDSPSDHRNRRSIRSRTSAEAPVVVPRRPRAIPAQNNAAAAMQSNGEPRA